MVKFVSKLISKIKGREYEIDSNIRTGDLLSVLLTRTAMLIRGFFVRLFFRKSGRMTFIGKGVTVKSKSHLSAENGLTIGDGCYINALCKNGIQIGKNFSLGRNSIIECTGVIRNLGEGLTIGDDVGIAANAHISVRGNVSIGSSTIFGPSVKLFSENHIFSDLHTPIYLQGEERSGITIGEDCWIGADTVILDGVTLGNHCVVAAGAVVNKSFPDYSVIGGVPAKLIKTRTE